MEFKKFNQKIIKQFTEMCKTGKLFRVKVSGQEVWECYLSSFRPENNQIFRDPESTEHNCNCCHNFIRRYGNIVSIDSDGNLESIFSNIGDIEEYTDSVAACNLLIISSEISNIFFETFDSLKSLPYEACKKNQELYQLGIAKNLKKYTQEEVDKFGVVNTEQIYEFNHFNVKLSKKFVNYSGDSIENIMAFYRDKYSVFKRAMEEIPIDTLQLVKDLINQGSLLDGTSHIHAINDIIKWKNIYKSGVNNNWLWEITYNMEERIAKFKNTLIGVLCTELAEGEELNKACQNWNKRVDPINYHKATAPITKRQIEEAKKYVEENGYTESFDRRLATIDDIKASEIKYINIGDGSIQKVSIFDNVKSTSTRHKRSQFDNIEEIGIEKFMKDILPSCNSLEIFFENRMEGNLVTLTTTKNEQSKHIFKWDNNYSWTFNGNLAGKSQIKDNVKSVGGKIDGLLRCSLQWNDKDTPGMVDFDLHCRENKGDEIMFSHKRSYETDGWLDVDMIRPPSIGIENITWQNNVPDMEYLFLVHNYDNGSNIGFKVEIEFDNNIYNYQFSGNAKGYINIATVIVKEGKMSIKHHLPESNQSKELWGLETNNFHKVNLVCLSPNHWGKNAVGNLHYLFMINDCKVGTPARGFHNENLIPELLNHRKVMEVLGATNMITPNEHQLSGIGFNSTVRDEVIIKCTGTHKRILKVKF